MSSQQHEPSGQPSEGSTPLLSAVLKLAGLEEEIDLFTRCGFHDDILPVHNGDVLPSALDPEEKVRFIGAQYNAIPKSRNDAQGAVKRGTLEHQHMKDDEFEAQFQGAFEPLGEGGYGQVLKAMFEESSEKLALKRFPRPGNPQINPIMIWAGLYRVGEQPQFNYPDRALRSFQRETETMKTIDKHLKAKPSHPISDPRNESHISQQDIGRTHVVQLRASLTTPFWYYLVMSPVGVCNLDELLKAYTSLPRTDLISWRNHTWPREDVTRWLHEYIKSIALVVRFLHDTGVWHNDITPKNFLCGRLDNNDNILDMIIRICDFGASLLRDKNAEVWESPTSKNLMWMPPEHERRTARDDMYNVGLIYLEIYTALKGSSPTRLEEYLTSRLAELNSEEGGIETSIPIRRHICPQEYPGQWLRELDVSIDSGADDESMIAIIERLVGFLPRGTAYVTTVFS